MKRSDWVFLATWALALLFVFGMSAAVSTPAALPFASFDGYGTSLILTNATAEPKSIASLYRGVGGLPIQISPFSSITVPDWPGAGGGVEMITLPAGVIGQVEIADPLGHTVRLGDLKPVTKAAPQLLSALPDSEEWKTYLFISSDTGASLMLQSGASGNSMDVVVPAGQTQIIPVKARDVLVSIGGRVGGIGVPTDGRAFIFALAANQITGDLTPVYGIDIQ
jgi:hypothetical protein